MIGFLILLSKKMKEKLPAAPHKLFWNFREAVDCCPWRVFLVWGTTVFFYFRKTCVSRRYFPRVRFGFWKKNRITHNNNNNNNVPKENEWKGNYWLSLADDFFQFFWKRRGTCCCCCHSFQVTKFWQMVFCLSCLSRVSHCLFWQNDAGRGGQSLQMFSLWLATGRGGRGGRNWFIPRLQSFKAHSSTTEERTCGICFNTTKKKRRANLFGCRISKKFWNEKIRGLWHNAENSLFSVNLRAKKCEIISSGRGHGAGWGGGLLGGGQGRGVLVPKIWINFFFFFYLVAAHRFVVFFFSGGKKLLEIICWIFVRKKRIGRRNLLNIFSFVVLLVRFEINHRVQLFGCVPVWMKWFFY